MIQMEQEVWLPIKQVDGRKEVSNWGNVRNATTKQLLKFSICGGGYCRVSIWANRKNKSFRVHRLVAEHFIPNKENKREVNHKDLNKLNNRADNLEWNTRLENVTHYFKNGFKGKVSDDDVLFIRKNIESIGCNKIAKILGINSNYVLSIANGTYKPNIYTDLIRDKKPSPPKEVVRLNCDGEVLEEYGSIGEVAMAYNTRLSAIQKVLEGEKISHKGMFFSYKREDGKYFVKKPREKTFKKGERRNVAQLDINGELIKTHKSIKEASISLGISTTGISLVICGKQKSSGGFMWKYVE